MKTFLRIYLFFLGIRYANSMEAQIITINTYGRVKTETEQRSNNKKQDSEKGNLDTVNKKIVSNAEIVSGRSFYSPLKRMVATSSYGWRRHPVTGERRFHRGVDLKAWYEPVYAIADGVVKEAGWGDLEGYYVVMTHGRAETIYCHLSKLLCSQGDVIKGGATVGVSGNTGRSTGPHLHLGVNYNGLVVNPIRLFEAIGL